MKIFTEIPRDSSLRKGKKTRLITLLKGCKDLSPSVARISRFIIQFTTSATKLSPTFLISTIN